MADCSHLLIAIALSTLLICFVIVNQNKTQEHYAIKAISRDYSHDYSDN